MTPWGKNLMKIQEDFQARMQYRKSTRSKDVASTPFAQSLAQKQKYFEDWNIANSARRQARKKQGPQVDAMTTWGRNLLEMQHDFEGRMQMRKARSVEVAPTPWEKGLVEIQKGIDARMLSPAIQRRRAQQFSGATEWGQSLVKLQEDLEARMQARSQQLQKSKSVTWAQDLEQTQEYYEKWGASVAMRRARRHREQFDGMTSWGQSLVEMQEQFKARMKSRGKEHIDQDAAMTPWAKGLVQIQNYFDAKIRQGPSTPWAKGLMQIQKHFDAKIQALEIRWADEDGLDGMTAWGQSLLTMQEQFETRMESRKESGAQGVTMTHWAKGLVQLQESFEARMRLRSKKPSPWAQELARTQKYFENRATMLAERRTHSTMNGEEQFDGVTAWGQDLARMQEEFQARMQRREERGLNNVATTPFARSLEQRQKYFEDWNAAILAQRQAREVPTLWEKGLVQIQKHFDAKIQALDAKTVHEDGLDGMTAWGLSLVTMQEQFEARMQSRSKKNVEDAPMTPWAKGLVQLQAGLEARMHKRTAGRGNASTRAQKMMKGWNTQFANRQLRKSETKLDVMTAWGQNLVSLQNEFEARMQSRSEGHSENAAMTPWARELEQLQATLETKMRKRRADRKPFNGMTAWGQGLLDMQGQFEARMRLRNKISWASDLVQTQKYFEDWKAAIVARRSDRDSLNADHLAGMTAWGQSLVDKEKEFEIRMQSRSQKVSESSPKPLLVQIQELRQEILDRRLEAKGELSWAREFPGAMQARTEHENRMQVWEAGKKARMQARKDRHEIAQATQDGFTQYFKARTEAQAQRRKDRTWAQGLAGAEEAQAMHETWKTEYEERRLARLQNRKQRSQDLAWYGAWAAATEELREQFPGMP